MRRGSRRSSWDLPELLQPQLRKKHLTCQACAEDFIIHLGTCRSSGCSSGCGSGLLILYSRERDRAAAQLLDKFFEVGLDDRDAGTVDDLDAVALYDDAGSACRLEQRLVDFAGIFQRQTKSRCAAVDVAGQVVQSADALEDRCRLGIDVISRSLAACNADAGRLAVLILGDHLDFFVVISASGSLEVFREDECAEDEEIQDEVDRDQRKDPDPVGLGISGKDTVKDQVNETIRESGADEDIEQVAEQECHTCKYESAL